MILVIHIWISVWIIWYISPSKQQRNIVQLCTNSNVTLGANIRNQLTKPWEKKKKKSSPYQVQPRPRARVQTAWLQGRRPPLTGCLVAAGCSHPPLMRIVMMMRFLFKFSLSCDVDDEGWMLGRVHLEPLVLGLQPLRHWSATCSLNRTTRIFLFNNGWTRVPLVTRSL